MTEEQGESHRPAEGQSAVATAFESLASWVPPWAREVPELRIEPAADSPPIPPLADAAAVDPTAPDAPLADASGADVASAGASVTDPAAANGVAADGVDAVTGGAGVATGGVDAVTGGVETVTDGAGVATDGAPAEPESSPSPEFGPQEKEVGRFAYGDADDLPDPEQFAPGLTDQQLRGALEAIMLVVDNPVTPVVLAQVLEEPTTRVEAMLEQLRAEYDRPGSGIDLRQVAGGWRFYTKPDYASYVERFVLDGQQIRLTQAALETLAVVAYKQPVTRSRVSAIRGVNCDGVMKTLLTRGLIEECGTEESGAHLYRTTQLFLEKLGINSVEDLPSLAQYLPENLDEIEAS
jgi:segregation and condensation protein B